MNKTDLRYEFKKWGDVPEVFIARNRNRRGKRYGFERFKGVKDVRWLERKPDNQVVGGLKMHINIPKHERERTIQGEANWNNKYIMERTSDKVLEGEKGKGNLEGATGQQLQRMTATTLYARVLTACSRNTGRGRNFTNPSPTGTISYLLVQLNIHVKEKTWLSNTWVGRLKNLAMFDKVQDDFMWNGDDDITPKYIGHDMILLLGLIEVRAQQLVREATKQGCPYFTCWKSGILI